MNQPLRISSAASLIVLGSMIAGCAGPQAEYGAATHFGGKADADTALATRALAALNSNNIPMAIDFAERAVAKTPNDAGFRALLGNAYFAAGRFHSAESAYRDALTLYPEQPQVLLKLALVEIAQGKNNQAVAVLNAGRGILDASNYGLALALAGRPTAAIAVLEPAARDKDAGPTVRQNLALAHALAGDWTEARTIAAQDVPAGQLDGRMQQWMQLAKPKHASDQVASLVGVTPAVVDAGQPVQLALNKADTQPAQAVAAAPPATPAVKAAQPSAKVASVTQPAPAAPVAVATIAASHTVAAAPAPQIGAPAMAAAPVHVASQPLVAHPAPVAPAPTIASMAASVVSTAKAVLASVVPYSHPAIAKPVKPHVVAAVARPRGGKSETVVQLGAYGSPARVLAAWNGASHKYAALKAYLPMSARFASPKGTFYRLSVSGFGSVREADAFCAALRGEGGKCFVRNFAGDAPVQYASR
jgi:Flp pilus assembly protein TadD